MVKVGAARRAKDNVRRRQKEDTEGKEKKEPLKS